MIVSPYVYGSYFLFLCMSYDVCVEYSHFRYVVAMGDSAFFPLEEFVAVVYLFSNLIVLNLWDVSPAMCNC